MNADELTIIIAAEHSLSKLYPHFTSEDEGLKFYAECLSEAYGPDRLSGNCLNCGADTQIDQPYVYQWEAQYRHSFTHTGLAVILALFGHLLAVLHLGDRHQSVVFLTYHRFCPGCAMKYRTRYVLAGIVIIPAILVASLCLLFLVFMPVIPFLVITSDWLEAEAILGGLSLVSGFAAFACWKFWTKCIVPPRLRFIAKEPFRLHQTHRLRWSEGTP